MKRHGNLFEKIVEIDNLRLADQKARKGKKHQYGVKVFDRNPEGNLLMLNADLCNKHFKTSEYTTFTVREPKERIVYRLPYFPDRIVHHAIMNIMEPLFVSWFTADTYSCIKGRGIHSALGNLKTALSDVSGTTYCLQMDVRKFYPSIDHGVIKSLLRRKIKDKDLLWLLDEIIDSATGLPIGNYLSQYLANFCLSYFDHWIKEEKRIKYYFRYADDMVILSGDKSMLHSIRREIQTYLKERLNLELKDNYQVYKITPKRGVNAFGYVSFHTHVLVRKTIKRNFVRMLKKNPNTASIASYKGWMKHADTKHLMKKLLLNEPIQRLQYKSQSNGIHRRQDKSRTSIEQPNNSSGI